MITYGIWKGLQLVGAEVKIRKTCAPFNLPRQGFQLVLGSIQKHQLLQSTDCLLAFNTHLSNTHTHTQSKTRAWGDRAGEVKGVGVERSVTAAQGIAKVLDHVPVCLAMFEF